jgi:hypothetical protein
MKVISLGTSNPTVFDHFLKLDTAATTGQWLATKGTGGALALNTTLGNGWINVPTAAADNDYQLLSTPIASFRVAPAVGVEEGVSLSYEARFKISEAAANTANVVFGFSSVLTTGFLANDGAGVPANFSGAVIYKKDGGSSLLAASSNGTAQTKDKVLCPFASGGTYTVAVTIDVFDSVNCRILFWVKDEASGRLYQPDELGKGVGVHTVPLANLAAMYPIFGVKAGSAAAETLSVDYVYAAQNGLAS